MKFSFADSGLALASAFAIASRPLYAQPITYSGYVDPHQEGWNWENGNGRGKLLDPHTCEELSPDKWDCGFSKVLAWMRGKSCESAVEVYVAQEWISSITRLLQESLVSKATFRVSLLMLMGMGGYYNPLE